MAVSASTWKYIGTTTLGGSTDIDDTLDDVRIGLWLERFWYFLENNNLLLGQDEEFEFPNH